ncbi:hypothetical protein BHE90_016738 [Fusarium euwallaceae]|uniref:Protein kinase domain-containing protein n=1 Tax=Fusarium euwallaceae TaxID=1147111 RepID=A0A430KZI7_9HYPO|nr:hypothetical protein BHE90_016738 [Fusarium euwallaceae]
MPAHPNIFDATAACRKSFVECQKFQVLAKAEWAENRLADFNLWASGIGASTRNRASLDARLALRPDARDVIVNLLRLLNAVVEGCMVLAESDTTQSNTMQQQQEEEKEHRGRTLNPPQQTTPQRSFSPWSGDSNSDSQSDTPYDITSDIPLSGAMKNVDSILDQLARIAIIIRQSGTRSRLQKADRMLSLEEDQDLRDHLIAVVLSTGPFSPEHTFSSEYIDPNKLSTVQLRLINCNLKRRNRFLYAQRHSEALDATSHTRVPSKEVTDQGKAPEQPEPESRLQQEPEKPPKPVSAKPVDQLHNPSVTTGTSASGVTDLPLLQQNLVPSQAATTQLSTTVIKLDYPHPPEVNEGALVFRCPCCCRVLPTMMLDKNRWKKHLAEDLCPYTCILPNCPKPETLYITKEAWKAHLLEDHRNVKSWVCFACVDAVRFDREDAFVTHTLQEHHGAISKDQIPTLKSICSRSVPAEISSCPLCPWPTEKDGEVDKGALIDHIAEEVHAFSLRSLPWGSDDEHETKGRIEYGAAKVRDWLSLAAAQETPPLPKAEKPSLPHYFDINKYFAENVDGSSSSGPDSNDTMQSELKKLQEEGPLVYLDSSDTQTRTMSSPTRNLAEFWKKNPSNPASRDDSYWFIKQCEGLASGLRKVHRDDSWPPSHDHIGDAVQTDSRNLGRHGNISPENILWFAEPGASRGRLVVAGFISMRFHSMDSLEYAETTKAPFVRTYCPPEVEAGPETGVYQKHDIWTLGCVYLEFITWYLIGYDAIRGDSFENPAGKRLESFNILRSKTDKKDGRFTDRFFIPNDGSGAKVKDSVKKWIRMLHGNQFCSQAMHDFLDLVENHMLVLTPTSRWPMDKVCAELGEILKGCQDNDRYCYGGDPRPLSNDDSFPPEFTEQSKQYAKFHKTTNSASTSPLERLHFLKGAFAGAFADAIPTGHQPSMPISLGDAHPSRLGDQPTGDGQSKAGQHLSPPDT